VHSGVVQGGALWVLRGSRGCLECILCQKRLWLSCIVEECKSLASGLVSEVIRVSEEARRLEGLAEQVRETRQGLTPRPRTVCSKVHLYTTAAACSLLSMLAPTGSSKQYRWWRIPVHYEQTVRLYRWRIPVHYEQTVRPYWWRSRSRRLSHLVLIYAQVKLPRDRVYGLETRRMLEQFEVVANQHLPPAPGGGGGGMLAQLQLARQLGVLPTRGR